MNPCLLIPIYDHGDTIPRVVASLQRFALPLLIVDDGSHAPTRETLERITVLKAKVAHQVGKHHAGRT